MVIWIIGLSGTGKTTLAREIQNCSSNMVLIDGDIIREVFGNDIGYSIEDRKKNAYRISRLCQFLEKQGVDVVCSILSIFSDNRLWNRKNISNYFEVFIDTPINILIKRDSKGLYGKYLSGQIANVAGMDLEFEKPDSDYVILNNSSKNDLLSHARSILKKATS